jgi:LacI family transcriptional regulator
MAEKRITIKDIAEKLSITPSTVSRALAGNTRISSSTRKRVIELARELGYEPNIIASTLRKGKSDTIGMIVPGINRTFFSSIISSVEEILNPAGFNLVIIQTHESLEKEKKAVQTLLRNRVGAVIMSLSVQTKGFGHLKEIVDNGIPLVQFDRVCHKIEGTKVVNDNFNGAYLSVRHLIKSGYKRVAHFTGSLALNVYRERLEGYKAALKEAGLVYDEALVFENSITRDTGRVNIKKAIEQFGADSLFSSGDFSALGAVDTLKEMKVKIPDEFGVIGFANEQFTGIMSPALTSVEQNTQEMGNRIARSVIARIKGEKTDEIITIPVRLIIRESSWKNKSIVTY